MNLYINRKCKTPVYEQICDGLIDRISSNQFVEGQQLPSVRELAELLSVSLVTAQKAYRLLAKRGYISSEKGRGNFVHTAGGKQKHRSLNASYDEGDACRWQSQMRDYIPRAQALKHMHFNDSSVDYSMSVASLNQEILPVQWVQKQAKAVIEKYPDALVSYSHTSGDPEFLRVARQYLTGLGINFSNREILAISGAQQGIELISKTFLSFGDAVIIESPAYIGSIDVLKARGVQLIPLPIDKDGLDVRKLLELCETYKPKLLYTNPTYQNPTGTTLSVDRRQQLAEIAESFQMLIIEDDSWSELYFTKRPPAPIQSFDQSGAVIYIKSFSKIMATGCRVAVLVAEQSIYNRLVAAKSISDLGTPLLTQKIVSEMIQSPDLMMKLQEIRSRIKKRADTTRQLLEKYALEMFGHTIIWHQPEGGMFFWLQLPRGIRDEVLLQETLRNRLSFLPGRACFSHGEEETYIRLSFANVPENQLQSAIHLLCTIINKCIKEKKKDSYPVI